MVNFCPHTKVTGSKENEVDGVFPKHKMYLSMKENTLKTDNMAEVLEHA